jgi:hypothetical protein
VFHPSTDDDDKHLVDVGSLGLALQFSKQVVTCHLELQQLAATIQPSFECRVYVLPDNREQSHKWETALVHVASLNTEFTCEQTPARVRPEHHESYEMPSKFLW